MAGISHFIRRQVTTPIPLANEILQSNASQNASDYKRRYPETSHIAWQQFYNLLPEVSFYATNSVIYQAQMMIYHPVQPDPWPCFRIVKSVDRDPDHGMRKIWNQSKRIAYVELFHHSAMLLEEQGFPEEAAYVRQAIGRIWPRSSLRDVTEQVTVGPHQDTRIKRKIPPSPYPKWR